MRLNKNLSEILSSHILKLFYIVVAMGLNWIYVPYQWHFLSHKGLSPVEILSLNTVFCIAAVIFEIPFGILADKWGRKKVILSGLFFSILSNIFFLYSSGWFGFAIANILASCSMTSISGADSAYLFDFLKTKNKQDLYPSAESFLSSIKFGVSTIGFIGASLIIIYSTNYNLLFIVTLIMSILAFLAGFILPEDSNIKHLRSSLKIKTIFNAISNKSIICFLIISFLLFPLFRTGIYFDPAYISYLGYPITIIGIFFALKSLFSSMLSPYASILLKKIDELTFFGVIALVIAFLLLLIQNLPPWGALTCLLIISSLFGLYSPGIKIVLNNRISDSSVRATIMSIEGMSRRTGFAIFSPFLGTALAYSFKSTLNIMAIIGFILALFIISITPFVSTKLEIKKSK